MITEKTFNIFYDKETDSVYFNRIYRDNRGELKDDFHLDRDEIYSLISFLRKTVEFKIELNILVKEGRIKYEPKHTKRTL